MHTCISAFRAGTLLGACLLSAGLAKSAAIDMGSVAVDVREAPRGIMKAHLQMPVKAGALTLVYPKWLPGRHSPAGPATSLAAPRFTIHGAPLAWVRDPVDMYAYHLDIPAGAISVGTRIEVDHLKAVPLGTFVRATARLANYKGRYMVFDVEARAGKRLIGRGRVFRAIVQLAQFHAKARSQSAS